MLRTVEAVIDVQGQVHLLEPISWRSAAGTRHDFREEPGTTCTK